MDSENIDHSKNIDDDELEILDAPKITPSQQEGTNNNFEKKSSKRARSISSQVWNCFTKIGVKNGKEKATYNGCGKEFVAGGANETSHLSHHISSCKLLPKFLMWVR